jgi:hypothetical protein
MVERNGTSDTWRNQVHGERLIQYTTTNPKSRDVLIPYHDGERCGGVGEGGEAAGGDSGSGSPPIFLQQRLAASLLLCF